MELVRRLRMRRNTRHIEITALNNSIDTLNNNTLTMIKLLTLFKEELDDRNSERDTFRNENKRKKTRKPKKVYND